MIIVSINSSMPDNFNKFITTGRKKESIERSTRRSATWLKNRIKDFQKQTKKGQTTRPGVGNMYLFNYKAKHDDKLPYWDRFPLIVMIDSAPGGFYGLNLHYLPPRKRVLLLNKLIEVSNLKNITDNSRMKLSYGIVKMASRFYKPTIKHYLFTQTRSKLIKIPPTDWENVAMLPLANFKGAGRPTVYADSLRKI